MATTLLLAACVCAVSGAMRVPSAVRMQLGGLSIGGASSKSRLLVIGGNGFVGRQVREYAVSHGANAPCAHEARDAGDAPRRASDATSLFSLSAVRCASTPCARANSR